MLRGKKKLISKDIAEAIIIPKIEDAYSYFCTFTAISSCHHVQFNLYLMMYLDGK